jgi:hypothetical protein
MMAKGVLTMRIIVTCAFALMLSCCVAAQAEERDVQSLYKLCKDRDSPTYGLCTGYISGIADMLLFLHAYNREHPENANPFQLCDTPYYGTMVQAFVNWAEKNPQKWSDPRYAGVMKAIFETWPCRGR